MNGEISASTKGTANSSSAATGANAVHEEQNDLVQPKPDREGESGHHAA
jgi:hypothetical protein